MKHPMIHILAGLVASQLAAVGAGAEHGAWIDTDGLSDPSDGVHFPREHYPVLGERFANQAVALIQKRSTHDNHGDEQSK